MYKRASWTESFVQWSPHGNYLATVHRQGVVVWGGASWQRLARFSHPGVCPTYSPRSDKQIAGMINANAPMRRMAWSGLSGGVAYLGQGMSRSHQNMLGRNSMEIFASRLNATSRSQYALCTRSFLPF